VHEIKHDGYRLQVRRDGDAVRLFARRGYDWSGSTRRSF
jgi:ATP-dependent DNA ligase